MKFEKSPRGTLVHQIPPEGVPITFRLASRAARIGAQVLDLLITYLGLLAVLLIALWLGFLSFPALDSLFTLLIFFVRIPYYMLAELVWNGRTLGKRIVRIRVISLDGGRLTPHQIAARNLMKEVEVFLPLAFLTRLGGITTWPGALLGLWVLGILAVPVFNRRVQRLGDMLAGTIVVDTPRAVLLPDLSRAPQPAATFQFSTAELDIYGRYELQVLEQILRDPPRSPAARRNVSEIARTIRRRIGMTEPLPEAQDWAFLTEFYRQQREYLESRNLFGDLRQDRHRAK